MASKEATERAGKICIAWFAKEKELQAQVLCDMISAALDAYANEKLELAAKACEEEYSHKVNPESYEDYGVYGYFEQVEFLIRALKTKETA